MKRSGSDRSNPRRWWGAWRVAALLLVAFVAAGLLWLRSRPERAPASAVDRIAAASSASALADSVDAAHARHDWMSAIRWGVPLVERSPRNSGALCDLALAVHNASLDQSAAGGRVRSPLRTSLQRIQHDRLAIALMDSASACAKSLEDWTRAKHYLGNFYEILGLPLEALDCYEAILTRAPRDSVTLARRYWVASHLIDPGATDFPSFDPRVDPFPNRVRRSEGR